MSGKWAVWLAFLIVQPVIAQHIKGNWEINYRTFWQEKNFLYWSYVRGELRGDIAGVPTPLTLTFKWYPLYRRGLPLELALKFNRDEMDRWLTDQIKSYTEGISDLIWVKRNAMGQLQKISMLQTNKMQIQERLQTLKLRGDTLGIEYKKLMSEWDYINSLELQKPEIERWYYTISDSIKKLQSMRRWNGWQAGTWLRENNMVPNWIRPFTYLREGAVGRFLLSSLPSQVSAPFILNGVEVIGQSGLIELGVHGGWSEGVLPPWSETPSGWRIGGFVGLNNDLAHFRVGITHWVDSLSKHSLPYIAIQRIKASKHVSLSGGAAKYYTKRRDTLHLINEGVSQPVWAIKEGNAYWMDATVSYGPISFTTRFSYYDKAFSNPTLPWVIPGRLDIQGNIRITVKKWYALLGTRQFRFFDTLWSAVQSQGMVFLGTGFSVGQLAFSLLGQITAERQYLVNGTVSSNLRKWNLGASSTIITGILHYQQYSFFAHRRSLFKYGLQTSYLQSNSLTSWTCWLFGGMAWWTIGAKWEFYSPRGHRIWLPFQAQSHIKDLRIIGSLEPGIHLDRTSAKPIFQITMQINHQWGLTFSRGEE